MGGACECDYQQGTSKHVIQIDGVQDKLASDHADKLM